MRPGRVLLRGARLGVRHGIVGRARGDGTVPSDGRWVPTTQPTGPFAGIDPHRVPGRVRRGHVVGLLLWAGLVARHVRGALRDREGARDVESGR